MKTLSLVSATTVLGFALLAGPVRADEPRALTLTPAIQALLVELLKSTDLEAAKGAASGDPSSAADTPIVKSVPTLPSVSTSVPADAHDSKTSLGSTSLRTSSLGTEGLMPSASLGGRGTAGGTPRLSEADWRALFPKKQDWK